MSAVPAKVLGHAVDTLTKDATAGSSTFRINVEIMVFTKIHFDFSHQSSTGDLHRAHTKVPRVSYTGDNFASMSSVLNKWVSGELPNIRSCGEFSAQELQRLQIVLFTLRDPELNAVYNGNADVWHVPRELEVMTREWGVPECEGRAGSCASRRTLSRGSDVVRSTPPGVDADTHEMVGFQLSSALTGLMLLTFITTSFSPLRTIRPATGHG